MPGNAKTGLLNERKDVVKDTNKRNLAFQIVLVIGVGFICYCAKNYLYWQYVTSDTRHPSLQAATERERVLRSPWRYIADLLPKASQVPGLRRPARRLERRIGNVEDFVASEIADVTSLVPLVCILNDHGGSDVGQPSERGRQSQALTMRVLQEVRADLVGVEGASLEIFTPQEEYEDLLRTLPVFTSERGLPTPTEGEAERFYYGFQCRVWAVRRYMVDHQVRGVGLEDVDLNELHILMLSMQHTGGYKDVMTHEEFYLLITAVHDARSDLALARMRRAARQAGAATPAFGFGASHGPRIRRVASDYNISVTFHECVP